MACMPQIFHPLINHFVMVFTSCGKWLDSQMTENFLYIKKIIALFHVNMLQKL